MGRLNRQNSSQFILVYIIFKNLLFKLHLVFSYLQCYHYTFLYIHIKLLN